MNTLQQRERPAVHCGSDSDPPHRSILAGPNRRSPEMVRPRPMPGQSDTIGSLPPGIDGLPSSARSATETNHRGTSESCTG